MGMITCPDCKRDISDAAPSCPGCGRPMKATAAPKEVKARSGIMDGVNIGCGIFIVLPLIILFLIFVIGVIGSAGK